MARPANRAQLMEHFGAIQVNHVWSWCAVNESERAVYLSVWTDHVEKLAGETVYTLQGPEWGLDEAGRKKPPRKDHDEKLSLVLDQGYTAYAYFIEAKDRTTDPREIADTRTSFVMEMRVQRSPDGWVTGTPVRRVEVR